MLFQHKVGTRGKRNLKITNSIALMMTASIEGGIMLCLTPKSSEPLNIISQVLSRPAN
jgi:hypothetical protein